MVKGLVVALAINCVAADPVRLWPGIAPGDVAGAIGPEVEKDGCYYNVTVPTYEAFLNESGSGGGVVVAPGGGYRIVAIEVEGYPVAKWLNSIGLHAFVLKYRVPARPQDPSKTPHWAPLMDAQRAMGLIRSDAAKYKLNASRLGFVGFSAGSHLTAHLSTTWRERIYEKISPEDDEPCRPDLALLNYAWEIITPNLTAVAPELVQGVGPSMPPMFFSHAMDDTTAPCENPLVFLTEAKKKSAPLSELHLYPSGGHGYGLCTRNQTFEVCSWPDRAATWFGTHKWI